MFWVVLSFIAGCVVTGAAFCIFAIKVATDREQSAESVRAAVENLMDPRSSDALFMKTLKAVEERDGTGRVTRPNTTANPRWQ